MAALAPAPKFWEHDSNGDPLASGLVYTYVANSSTPLATYTDAGGGSANQNPVVLDSAGRADIWLLTSSLYKFIVKTSAGATVYTVDYIGGSVNVSDLAASTGSALVGFLQAGTGAVLRTAQAKMREWISVKDFGAVGDGTTDDTDAVQAAIDYWKTLLTTTNGDNGSFLYGTAGLLFPSPGKYVVTTTLDFTGVRVFSGTIRMDGSIIGKTSGTPIIDQTDSRGLTWDYLNLQAPVSASAPNVGILLARRSDGRVAGEHHFNRPIIQGNFTVAPWYNYGSEEVICVHPIFTNNYDTGTPLVQYTVGSNVASVTSPYQTINTADASTNGARFIKADFRALGAGYISRIDGVNDFVMEGYCSMTGSGSRDSFHYMTLVRDVTPTGVTINMHNEAPALTVAAILCIEPNASRSTVRRIDVIDQKPQTVDDIIAVIGFSGATPGLIEGFSTSQTFTATTRKIYASVNGGTGRIHRADIINNGGTAFVGSINLAGLLSFSGQIQTESVSDITFPATYAVSVITTRKTFNLASVTTETIASGNIPIVAAMSNVFNLVGEGGVADDLVTLIPDTATATPQGMIITMRNNQAYDITVKNTAAAYSIRTKSGSDVVLTASAQKAITLMMFTGATDGTTNRWTEV